MPYSKQTFPYTTGARTFTLALASDYDYESNISVYVVGELTGGGDQIFRAFTFDSEFVINVTDSLDNPSSVVIQRTVSPTVFSVDFEAGADVTKRNLQLAFRQQFFLMQEIIDGRVDGVDIGQRADDAEAAATSAASSATSASVSMFAAAISAALVDSDELINRSGTVDFTAVQIGVTPTADMHISTKKYVDDVVGGGGVMLLDGTNQMTAQLTLKAGTDPAANDHAARKLYVDNADALKANLASPTLTGNPIAPTQTLGNDSTRIATTEFVTDAITAGGANAFASALLHVRDEKSSGTSGGSFTKDGWRTRDVNTVLTNEISGASLAANVITLPAGTYDCEILCPCSGGNSHKAKLRQTSVTAADTLIGMSSRTASTAADTVNAVVRGRFTIAAEEDFEIQHRCSTTKSTGFGQANGFSVVEVYTDAKFWKVA